MNRLAMLLLILLGGLLFNLDRLGMQLIRQPAIRHLVPYPVRKLVPGGDARETVATAQQTLEGTILDVYDGDTATLLSLDGERRYKIRFYGMDAPEKDQLYGLEAQKALAAVVGNRPVKVLVVDVDPYQRCVGKVFVDDLYVNLAMVLEGNAWWYSQYAEKDTDLRDAEQEARRMRRGLWRDANPTAPWQYRQNSR